MAVKFDPILGKLREKDTDADSIDMGDTVTDGTEGSILFVGTASALSQDNAKLFWNGSTNKLGIGVADPDSFLEVYGTTTQQKWSYDANSFASVTVADASHTTVATGESGNLTLDSAGDLTLDADSGTMTFADGGTTLATIASLRQESFIIAASDETTDLTTGDGKVYFVMPYAFTVIEVKVSVNTAPVGSTLTVQVTDDGDGNNITSSAVSIAAAAKLGTTTSIAAGAIAEDSIIGVNIDQIGSSTAGTGLKVVLIGYQTV